MHRTLDNGIVYSCYGGIGFVQRIEASKSAGFFAALRWLLKLLA